jgi:ankyrin repeat protein
LLQKITMEQSKAKTTPFLLRVLGFGRKSSDIIDSEGLKPTQGALNTRLFKAIQISDNAEIKRVLEQGADPNTTDNQSWTLLHHAASKGNAKACKLLVKHGADVNAMTESTNTPLCLANITGSKKAAEFLESVGGRTSSYA